MRGGLAIDWGALPECFNGKYVLTTNELDLPPEELVPGYRDRWRAERGFRSMKSVLRMEAVHHRAERRIVAHAHLCVLSYLLMRIAENRTGESSPLFRERLDRVSVGRIETDHASNARVKRLTDSECKVWLSCGVEEPAKTNQVTTQ